MRTHCALALAAAIAGCYGPESFSTANRDLAGSTPDPHGADLSAVTPAPCAAAQGLPGTNLFCADLKNFASVEALRVANWGVNKDKSGSKECWEIVPTASGAKAIQIVNFKQYQDLCSFIIPAIPDTMFANYNSFTLSIVQTLDIERKQSAAVFLFQSTPERQIWSNTGTNPHQISTITITKPDVLTISPKYQPVFQLQSAVPSGLSGWQIESIAINGTIN